MTAFAFPYRERGAPVTVAGDSPVLNVFKPVAEASFADRLRYPVYRVVVTDEVILYSRFADVPGFSCVIDEGGVASPAMRLVMLKLQRVKEQKHCAKVVKHHRVGFLYKYAGVRCFGGHIALAVNELNEGKVILLADLRVIFTECGSDMNDAGTVCKSYISVTDDVKSLFALLFADVNGAVEKRLVFFVFEFFSRERFENFICGRAVL